MKISSSKAAAVTPVRRPEVLTSEKAVM